MTVTMFDFCRVGTAPRACRGAPGGHRAHAGKREGLALNPARTTGVTQRRKSGREGAETQDGQRRRSDHGRAAPAAARLGRAATGGGCLARFFHAIDHAAAPFQLAQTVQRIETDTLAFGQLPISFSHCLSTQSGGFSHSVLVYTPYAI